jgi:hypothetical protein
MAKKDTITARTYVAVLAGYRWCHHHIIIAQSEGGLDIRGPGSIALLQVTQGPSVAATSGPAMAGVIDD